MKMITLLRENKIATEEGIEVEVIMVGKDQQKIKLWKKGTIITEVDLEIQGQIYPKTLEIMKQVKHQVQIEIKITILIIVNLKIHIGL